MSSKYTTLDTRGLKTLRDLFAGKTPYVKVGVLGSDTNRKGGENTNAEIGAVHEFGSPANNIPRRSFLRMPISEKLDSELSNSGFFNKKTFDQPIKEKSLLRIMKKIGILCERIVQDAFDTSGFGSWKESNMKDKKTKQTLVETTQLRRSISSEVVDE